jgi:biotin operon repressor BirA-like protein
MPDMVATGSRTLRLLSLLQAQRHWSGEELARRLGVSVRTLRRDVERLRELGYPVEAQRGVDGDYALAPGAATRPGGRCWPPTWTAPSSACSAQRVTAVPTVPPGGATGFRFGPLVSGGRRRMAGPGGVRARQRSGGAS